MNKTSLPARANARRRKIAQRVPRGRYGHRNRKPMSGLDTMAGLEPAAEKTHQGRHWSGFPQFSRLPQEIRLLIWDLITDEPRVVVIHSGREVPRQGFRSPSPAPAALHACVESREVALKKYELSFSSHDPHYRLDHPARIWFNFDRDVVYFRAQDRESWTCLLQFRTFIPLNDLKRIQFLGTIIQWNDDLPRTGPPPIGWPVRGRGSWIQEFGGLKVYYRCLEHARFNARKTSAISALEGDKRALVRQYRFCYGKDGRFKGLSTPAAFEKIRRETRTGISLEEFSTPEVTFATITNSRTL